MRQYLFAFEDHHAARRFVRSLVKELDEIALYVEDCHVKVFDGGLPKASRHERIMSLSRSSSARWLLK